MTKTHALRVIQGCIDSIFFLLYFFLGAYLILKHFDASTLSGLLTGLIYGIVSSISRYLQKLVYTGESTEYEWTFYLGLVIPPAIAVLPIYFIIDFRFLRDINISWSFIGAWFVGWIIYVIFAVMIRREKLKSEMWDKS